MKDNIKKTGYKYYSPLRFLLNKMEISETEESRQLFDSLLINHRASKAHWQSYLFGVDHISHTYAFAYALCIFQELNLEDMRIVLLTTIYHDIGRKFREDFGYGERSARLIGKYLTEENDETLRLIQAVMHSLDFEDDIFLPELFEYYHLPERIRERYLQIQAIVKDADLIDLNGLQYGFTGVNRVKTKGGQNAYQIVLLNNRKFYD